MQNQELRGKLTALQEENRRLRRWFHGSLSVQSPSKRHSGTKSHRFKPKSAISLSSKNCCLRKKHLLFPFYLLHFLIQSEWYAEKPPAPFETPSTPTKFRVVRDSLASSSLTEGKSIRSVHLANKSVHPTQVVEDSLVQLDTPRPSKRVITPSSSFLSKRPTMASGILEENSELSLALDTSTLHLSGPRRSTGAQEPSLRSCSSILSDGGDSSLLRDVEPAIDFASLSFSDASHENAANDMDAAAVAAVAPDVDDMSYSALLRLERQQGGVLDDRWAEVREDVIKVGERGD